MNLFVSRSGLLRVSIRDAQPAAIRVFVAVDKTPHKAAHSSERHIKSFDSAELMRLNIRCVS
jgi:hypothetical protein